VGHFVGSAKSKDQVGNEVEKTDNFSKEIRMAITVIIHVSNADAVMAEIEEMPNPTSNFLVCTNARARDGKNLIYIERDATRVIFPWHRISFIETLPSEEDQVQIESFFRD
jgi:hypothetical protein